MGSSDDDLAVPLIDRFVRARSNEIEYRGRRVYAAYKLEQIPPGAVLGIRWIQAKSNPVQGLQLHSRPGSLKIEGHTAKHIIVWRDTAPDHITAQVVGTPRSKPVDIVIRNTWRTSAGSMASSQGNAGMVVERIEAEAVLNCSDGEGPPQFDDLVVAIAVT
jgi:hypothetical protein